MDSVTQAALGAAIGEAAFSGKLGRKAALFGGACALVPDLDMFVGLFGDEWTTLVYHRAFSHSLLVLPLLALPVGWLGWKWDRKRTPYLVWLHVAFWALVSHPLLDWFTSYGTMLFLPLTWRRYAGDGVFIIDPIYSLPLFGALLWSWLRRKRIAGGEGPPVSQARPRAFGARLARLEGRHVTAAALVFTTAYLLFGLGVTEHAKAVGRRELAALGFEPVCLRAMPTALFPTIRRVVARDAGGTVIAGPVSTWSGGPISFTCFEMPDAPVVRRALESREGRILSWFADGFVTARLERDAESGAATVYLVDLRYGFLTNPAASPFEAKYVFDAGGRLTNAELLGHNVELSFGEEMAAMWRLMWGRGG